MPDEITVALRVVSPSDKIALERTADAEPTMLNTDVGPHAVRLIGELADEVLAHYGYSNAYGQYVEIANILSGHDTGTSGAQVDAVRELLDRVARTANERDDARNQLAWASNPANWSVEPDGPRLRHQPGRAFLASESPAWFGGEAAELRTHYLPPEEAARHMKPEVSE